MKTLLISIAIAAQLSAFVPTTVIAGEVNFNDPRICEKADKIVAYEKTPDGPTTYAFTIKTDGSVTDVTVKSSSGNETLDRIGAICITRWRYKPGMKDGKPVEVPWQANIAWKKR